MRRAKTIVFAFLLLFVISGVERLINSDKSTEAVVYPLPQSISNLPPTPTPAATPSGSIDALPTPDSPLTISPQITPTPMSTAITTTITAISTPEPLPIAVPEPNLDQQPPSILTEPLVLANYYPWFDDNTWASGITSDLPTEPYNSDDPKVIARHLAQASQAGINGFISAWLIPGDRTDRNFAQLLTISQGTNFQSAPSFQTNSLPNQTQESIAQTLAHIVNSYGQHPNYLHHQGKPVIFFTNMPRVPVLPNQTPQQAWQAIREKVDPQRSQIWIAEGLDTSYLAVFDGLYVIKIAHRDYPDDYLKLPRWGSQVRNYAASLNTPKLWVATIMPGWDDLHTADGPNDLRIPSAPSARNRENGQYYVKTFTAALESTPDWLLISSFNEWVEGTQIEPSVTYENQYLQLTAEFASKFREASPR
ncbi:MAG: glycoside hydrolase family 99-like domain-containing protein [Chloroflexi bacterium]|nr:glycoside hydrolase family 99-like domain-containing protein [Chloroflexota bacterium]